MTLALQFHPHRGGLFNELHTRPFPVIASPARVSSLTVLHAKDDNESPQTRIQEYEHICDLCQRFSAPHPSPARVESKRPIQAFHPAHPRQERGRWPGL